MRHLASSCPNDTPPRPIPGSFFPKPRCARQVKQTRRRRPSSSCTSIEAATRGLPSLCQPTVRLLRSKHRLAARETLCIPAKLTVDKLLDWFLQCGWLPMATYYDWLGDVHWNSSSCNGDGRSRPAVPFVRAHLDAGSLVWRRGPVPGRCK